MRPNNGRMFFLTPKSEKYVPSCPDKLGFSLLQLEAMCKNIKKEVQFTLTT